MICQVKGAAARRRRRPRRQARAMLGRRLPCRFPGDGPKPRAITSGASMCLEWAVRPIGRTRRENRNLIMATGTALPGAAWRCRSRGAREFRPGRCDARHPGRRQRPSRAVSLSWPSRGAVPECQQDREKTADFYCRELAARRRRRQTASRPPSRPRKLTPVQVDMQNF